MIEGAGEVDLTGRENRGILLGAETRRKEDTDNDNTNAYLCSTHPLRVRYPPSMVSAAIDDT